MIKVLGILEPTNELCLKAILLAHEHNLIDEEIAFALRLGELYSAQHNFEGLGALIDEYLATIFTERGEHSAEMYLMVTFT